VRLSKSQGGRIGRVESAANGYYLIRLQDAEQGAVKVRGAEMEAIQGGEVDNNSGAPVPDPADNVTSAGDIPSSQNRPRCV
jgi:hypothetical protein